MRQVALQLGCQLLAVDHMGNAVRLGTGAVVDIAPAVGSVDIECALDPAAADLYVGVVAAPGVAVAV